MAGAVFVLYSLVLFQTVSTCHKECSCDTNAKVVDCRGRGLYDIPRELHQDTLELYLQNNHLRGLGSMSFQETPQLQILDLTNNSITTLSPSSLLGLKSLRVLSLANNSIREVDRRLLVSIKNLTILDLSFNTIGGLPGGLADSFHFLTHLSLHYNRLTKLDRIHLEALGKLKVLQLKGNPWKCDCHLIGLKLWLETFAFKGGVVDSVTCIQPHLMLERDLRHIPYELFQSCMITSYSYLFANIHYLDNKHRMLSGQLHPSPKAPSGGDFSPSGEAIFPECEAKQRSRPVNYRHAIATVVITGIVCGIVCLMMLAAAVYGCAYAAINAKYQRELKKKAKEAGSGDKQKNIEREEHKKPLD
ncbi:leucine-rich repeat and transmembrane domain-containing protein 1-like [Carassius carassius]|uniref:leucine-rich repeat and transmembrane domain-containing protein 1-like n=1 Tax=Carassius carassius TaxID=217509 RepID=UPI002868AEB3|nr:leucine-rich repeat and transmembrane domain-containing protein 1-like [Carassius carassius]